jgi:carboxylesterase type B
LFQERFLAFTNSFEGTIFVNPNFTAQQTVSDYVAQLFPNFNESQIKQAVAQYDNVSTLTTTNDKAIAIMGECKL